MLGQILLSLLTILFGMGTISIFCSLIFENNHPAIIYKPKVKKRGDIVDKELEAYISEDNKDQGTKDDNLIDSFNVTMEEYNL